MQQMSFSACFPENSENDIYWLTYSLPATYAALLSTVGFQNTRAEIINPEEQMVAEGWGRQGLHSAKGKRAHLGASGRWRHERPKKGFRKMPLNLALAATQGYGRRLYYAAGKALQTKVRFRPV
ncbi:hypothetical protein, partial [Rufibacter ruber]|uniref:hypothetical protein n=1 Tax=Rufibacter ruber TaxID=1783499 RepID=UPI00128FED90